VIAIAIGALASAFVGTIFMLIVYKIVRFFLHAVQEGMKAPVQPPRKLPVDDCADRCPFCAQQVSPEVEFCSTCGTKRGTGA